MITVVSKCIVKQNKIGAFKTLARELVEEGSKESGCISYELHQDVASKNILTFIEKWESKEAADTHKKSVYYKFLTPKLELFQEQDPEVQLFEIAE